MKNFIAYYRVSTQKQGVSGLGLDAQLTAVNNFVQSRAGNLISSYTEIETGKNNNRQALNNAIKEATQTGATLLIAKLDRLSRNASFIFQLKDSKVNFICCDMPDANNLTIGIFALIAQQERELISKRTKDALQEKKRRGYTLGTPENLTDRSRKLASEALHNKAQNDENNLRAFALIDSLRPAGLSYAKIASKLNDNGFKTSKGNSFYPMTVKQLYISFKMNKAS